MSTVGSFEAKTRFAKLLDRVANGERITITEHGVPVAVLVPPPSSRARQTVFEVIEKLNRFREAHPLNGITIRELIDEGRRCTTP